MDPIDWYPSYPFKFKVGDRVRLEGEGVPNYIIMILALFEETEGRLAAYRALRPNDSTTFDYNAAFVERVGTLHLNGIQRLLAML